MASWHHLDSSKTHMWEEGKNIRKRMKGTVIPCRARQEWRLPLTFFRSSVRSAFRSRKHARMDRMSHNEKHYVELLVQMWKRETVNPNYFFDIITILRRSICGNTNHFGESIFLLFLFCPFPISRADENSRVIFFFSSLAFLKNAKMHTEETKTGLLEGEQR